MTEQYRRNPASLHAAIGSDYVALNVDKGRGYGLEGVTALVWELLDQPQDLDSLCAELIQRYDVDEETCRKEILALLHDMCAEQLVQRIDETTVDGVSAGTGLRGN